MSDFLLGSIVAIADLGLCSYCWVVDQLVILDEDKGTFGNRGLDGVSFSRLGWVGIAG